MNITSIAKILPISPPITIQPWPPITIQPWPLPPNGNPGTVPPWLQKNS